MDRKTALWLVAGLILTGCGKDAATCETFACTNANSYRLCSTDSTLTYSYGGQTCGCDNDADNAACQACYAEVATFCGSADGGATSASCMTTFTGGIMGTIAPCGVTVTQTTATTWTIAGGGAPVPTTADIWNGFTMTNTGTVAIGGYDENDSTQTIAGATAPSSGSTEGWNAGFGQGASTGAFFVQLVSLGDGTTGSDGSIAYPDAHGKITATLVDPFGGAVNVSVIIEF